jgi:alkylhydroperoxidase/carboxymuconolactone decarboxylase family protein YurZ
VKQITNALFRSKHVSARNLAIACIALSGAVQLFLVPDLLSHNVARASFLAFIGVAQVLWALRFRWRPSAALYWAGVALSGGVIATWMLTLFMSTAYSSPLGPIGGYFTVSRILESTGLLALITHGAATLFATTDRTSIYRLVGRSILVAAMFGALVWGGGIGVELIYSGDQEGAESQQLSTVPEVAAVDPRATPDIQAMVDAAVESALAASEMNDASSSLPPEIQEMIRVAVDSALRQETKSTPTPGLSSEIQDMVAVAVAAALKSNHALTPEPGQLAGNHGPAAEELEYTPADQLPDHHGQGGHAGSPDGESAPISLTARPDLASRGPTLPLDESAATPAPSAGMAPMETLLRDENQSNLKMILFGGALVALILIAVVGAVRTWNDIT